jgi:hypothetical protein
VKLTDGKLRYFRYLALPFGWSRSGYWFSRLASPYLATFKSRFGYRVLSYVDHYLICRSTGTASKKMDCLRVLTRLDKLFLRYGITRHPKIGFGGWVSMLQHLNFIVDSVRGSFGVPASKLDKVSSMDRSLLRRFRCNARKAPRAELESFIGKAQILRLAVQQTALRLRALYDAIPPLVAFDGGHRCTWTGPAISFPAQGPWHSFPHCDPRPSKSAGMYASLIPRYQTSSTGETFPSTFTTAQYCHPTPAPLPLSTPTPPLAPLATPWDEVLWRRGARAFTR